MVTHYKIISRVSERSGCGPVALFRRVGTDRFDIYSITTNQYRSAIRSDKYDHIGTYHCAPERWIEDDLIYDHEQRNLGG